MSTYRDFMPSRRLGMSLALSPDGNTVAYSDDSTGRFELVLQDIDSGRQRRMAPRLESGHNPTFEWPSWHPDGRSLVYFMDPTGSECPQLYRLDLDADEPRALTGGEGVRRLASAFHKYEAFSPDGSRIAYAANDREPSEQDVVIQDLGSGDLHRLSPEHGLLTHGYWAPDGKSVTVSEVRTNSDRSILRFWLDGTVELLTPRRKRVRDLPGPWLPDGSGFVTITDSGRDFRGLARFDIAGRELTWLHTPDHDVEQVALSADGRLLVWTENIDGYSRLAARDLATGQPVPTPPVPNGVMSGVSISRDGRLIAFRHESPTRPSNLGFVDLASGRQGWLTEITPETADPSTFIEPNPVRYPSFDERQVPGYLFRPAGDGPHPVVLSIHGGPEMQERPGYGLNGFYQHLLSRGVGVFAPNARGSTGYGKTYQCLLHRDWGGGDLADFDHAVKYLRTLDWVDGERIAVFGASYGGFAVLSCVSRLPDHWRAAVDIFGPSDLVTMLQRSVPTWKNWERETIGDVDTEADFLKSRSPITYAHQIKTPLFVVQGANDVRIVKAESDQIVEALRERGIPVRYDVYPDEGHGFAKRDNWIKAFGDSADFLVEQLNSRSDGAGN